MGVRNKLFRPAGILYYRHVSDILFRKKKSININTFFNVHDMVIFVSNGYCAIQYFTLSDWKPDACKSPSLSIYIYLFTYLFSCFFSNSMFWVD